MQVRLACRPRGQTLLNIGLSAVVSACGLNQLAIERMSDTLAARYSAQFACASPEVTQSPDGFRVEGCGQVAFYHCEWLEHQHRCVLEHARSMTEQERLATVKRAQAGLDDAVAVQDAEERRRKLDVEFANARRLLAARPGELQPLGQVKGDDWRIELARLPDHAAFVLWRFSTERALLPAPCRPTIVGDGRILTAEAIAQHSSREVTFLLTAGDVESLGTSERIRGVVCGVPFSLDEAARRQLASLAARH